jgi:hypothetical protein
MHGSGHEVDILDLAWAKDVGPCIDAFFDNREVDLIGVTLRNSDDCAFTTRQSFLVPFASIVERIRGRTEGLIVVGGAGFSVVPKEALELCRADVGVRGEGEFVFPALADRLEKKRPFFDLPNLLWKRDGEWMENPLLFGDLAALPPMRRRWFDNSRYFHEGGQAGVETKRGCPLPCIYCADPVAKGRVLRLRPPQAVADEVEALLCQGIDHFHTCDSEFNLPESHARAVCEALIERRLGDKVRWYAYCTPLPFSLDTARLMRRAGCAGINFGVDHGDPKILRRLKRAYSPEEILDIAAWCKEGGIVTMFDLLIGSPGESKQSLTDTIDLMRRSKADRVGIALGIRVWPGTEMAKTLQQTVYAEGLIGGGDPTVPLYYIEPAVAADAADWIDAMIGDDPRFLFFNPKEAKRNYNYNDNRTLVEAIRSGHRGAYWDILRRISV